MIIVDRRGNPSGKSLPNRERFLRRLKQQATVVARRVVRDGSLTGPRAGEKISVPGGIAEPKFGFDRAKGDRDFVVPGSGQFSRGDTIEKPKKNEGGNGSGGEEGEDAFEFVLTRQEFWNILYEGLALPEMMRTELAEIVDISRLRRAGYALTGSPTSIDVPATMRRAMARRVALGYPGKKKLDAASQFAESFAADDTSEEAEAARNALLELEERRRTVTFLDPIDIRHRRFVRVPQPDREAVMFCMMDASGSMTEHMKELAKMFFMLLHRFLVTKHEKIEIVFIRHTHVAKTVDEGTFFHDRENGGTIVSTAFDEMIRLIKEQFSPRRYNIYAAYAGDGDNSLEDSKNVRSRMGTIMPQIRYFAYLEVDKQAGWDADVKKFAAEYGHKSKGPSELWKTFEALIKDDPDLMRAFAMKKVFDQTEIFPIFLDLFKKREASPAAAYAPQPAP